MFDKNKFKGVIVSAGEKVDDVAKLFEKSSTAVYLQISNGNFTRKEIFLFMQHYKLSAEEIVSIFFAKELA